MARARTSCECNRREHDWTHRPAVRENRGEGFVVVWDVLT